MQYWGTPKSKREDWNIARVAMKNSCKFGHGGPIQAKTHFVSVDPPVCCNYHIHRIDLQ
jgi:hypothetical protein